MKPLPTEKRVAGIVVSNAIKEGEWIFVACPLGDMLIVNPDRMDEALAAFPAAHAARSHVDKDKTPRG